MRIPSLRLSPIGSISTPYRSKYGAPRQPATSSATVTGLITLLEHHNFEQALEDLDGFEFIWVVFWLHANSTWKPKVLPPHGGRKKRGVFATRSPHRPNPIGLSLCKLIAIKGRTLTIESPDMLDGTPILDLKPYLPHSEAFPDARSGWIGESHELSPREFSVSFSPEFEQSTVGIPETERQEILRYVTGTLSSDPFPHAYRRIKSFEDGTFQIAVRRWRFLYSVREGLVNIFGIAHDIERGGRA